jgi:hypothetical protein
MLGQARGHTETIAAPAWSAASWQWFEEDAGAERFPIFCVQLPAKNQNYVSDAVRLDSHFASIRIVTPGR